MTGSVAAPVPSASSPQPGAQRLRTSRDVRAVFAARRASGSDVAVVHARPRDDDGPARVTVVAGKAVGNAVQRNRVKRRLRAATAAVALRRGADYVVVGRAGALSAPAAALRAGLQRQFEAVWNRP